MSSYVAVSYQAVASSRFGALAPPLDLGRAKARPYMLWHAVLLEAEDRSEGNAQIVVRAVVEVDFVAYVKTKANGSYMRHQSAAGIENGVHVVRAQVIHAADKVPGVAGALSMRKSTKPPFSVTNG
jgi:hypothetical protein